MKTNKDTQQIVLQEIASDRKNNFEDHKKLLKDYSDQIEAINTRDAALVEEYGEAKASLKSVERFEKHVSKQDFDQMRRDAQAIFDEVAARHKIASKKATEELAPLQERIQASQTRSQELTAEWNSYRRIAKAADIDLSQFWTPENPK